MKTTNLLVDYVLVGAVWVLSFCAILDLSGLFSPDLVDTISDLDAALIPAALAIVYVVGVALDQFSNRILELLSAVLRTSELSEYRDKLFGTKLEYHCALQRVVIRSQRAFDYLSYRRSAYRVVRSLFAAVLIVVPFAFVSTVYEAIKSDPKCVQSAINSFLLILAFFFLRAETIRLHKGYLSALHNFDCIICHDFARHLRAGAE